MPASRSTVEEGAVWTERGKISTVSGARPKFSPFYERSGRQPGALTKL